MKCFDVNYVSLITYDVLIDCISTGYEVIKCKMLALSKPKLGLDQWNEWNFEENVD